MDFQALQGEPRRLRDAARGLAVLGAALQLRQGKIKAHPVVDARLADAVAALLPSGLEGLDQNQADAALGIVTFALGESRDLFETPERPPGWTRLLLVKWRFAPWLLEW